MLKAILKLDRNQEINDYKHKIKLFKTQNLLEISILKRLMLSNNININKLRVKNPKVLYGGAVNSKNVKNLALIKNIDGFLIGGASQKANNFIDTNTNFKHSGEFDTERDEFGWTIMDGYFDKRFFQPS